MKTKKTTLTLCQASGTAALYVILCTIFMPISFGPFQCRIAEALTILPYFTPAAIPGLTIGCLLSNLLLGNAILDVIFGTLATFLGALFTYFLRKHKWLLPIPPIAFNTLIIPYVIRFAYAESTPILILMGQIFVGEFLSCGVLGLLLLAALKPMQKRIFPNK